MAKAVTNVMEGGVAHRYGAVAPCFFLAFFPVIPLDTEGGGVIVSFSPPARRHENRAVARESLLEN